MMSKFFQKFGRVYFLSCRYSSRKFTSFLPTSYLQLQKVSPCNELYRKTFLHHIHISASSLSPSPNEQPEHNTSETSSEEEEPYEELKDIALKYAELNVDDETNTKIRMILMEHEVSKQEGKQVPSRLTIEDMKELLLMYSFSSRMKYMHFLFDREYKRANDVRKKERKKKEREEWMVEKENIKPPHHIQYGIGHNTMILRVRRKSVMQFYNKRLANAALNGQKFIVDLDYDCYMRKMDCNNCGEQLLELYSINRKNHSPYDLYFCNVDHKNATMSAFGRYMPNLYSPDNFLTLTNLNYTDIFPKEKLVYITPHAKEPMRSYDHNAIYIIGGIVDKCIKEPVVLAKAKREQVHAVHLPYDEYLMWGKGNKSLPLNIILDILLTMKNTNDWKKAFKRVPPRKLIRSLDMFSEF